MYDAQLSKLRRQLDKLGYSLVKRGRGAGYGYMIVNQFFNTVEAGERLPGLSLDEVEDWLSDE